MAEYGLGEAAPGWQEFARILKFPWVIQKRKASLVKYLRGSGTERYVLLMRKAIARLGLVLLLACPKSAIADLAELERDAAKGIAEAQNDLGLMYQNGEGVPQDDVKAAEWFQKAADQANAEAQTNLGAMYANGKGVAQDDAKAVAWFQRAASHGLAEAQFNLGLMYAKGRGVPIDEARAVEWYQKAAAQGFVEAQNNLGIMYAKGRGVPKDYVRADAWLKLAAAQGDTAAPTARDSVEKLMTAEQRTEAEKLQAELSAKMPKK